jgi:hypothetical protein
MPQNSIEFGWEKQGYMTQCPPRFAIRIKRQDQAQESKPKQRRLNVTSVRLICKATMDLEFRMQDQIPTSQLQTVHQRLKLTVCCIGTSWSSATMAGTSQITAAYRSHCWVKPGIPLSITCLSLLWQVALCDGFVCDFKMRLHTFMHTSLLK